MTTSINLVKFKDHLYPVSPDDYKVMIASGVSAARLPVASLDILKATLLKGVKVTLHAWADAFEALHTRITEAAAVKGLQVKVEGPTIFILQPEGSESECRHLLDQITHYMSRYSLRTKKEAKTKPSGAKLWRLAFTYDLDIPNALFYSDAPKPATVATVDFQFWRVHFAIEDISGVPSFVITTQDKINSEWVSSGTNRSFPLRKLSRENAYELANFFLQNF